VQTKLPLRTARGKCFGFTPPLGNAIQQQKVCGSNWLGKTGADSVLLRRTEGYREKTWRRKGCAKTTGKKGISSATTVSEY